MSRGSVSQLPSGLYEGVWVFRTIGSDQVPVPEILQRRGRMRFTDHQGSVVFGEGEIDFKGRYGAHFTEEFPVMALQLPEGGVEIDVQARAAELIPVTGGQWTLEHASFSPRMPATLDGDRLSGTLSVRYVATPQEGGPPLRGHFDITFMGERADDGG